MNLTGPRGRYETLPARDTSFDDDQDELQSVLTSNQIENTGAPSSSSSRSLQQRTQRNSYGDSTDDDLYFDDNHLHNDSYSDDSFSDDNEKQTTSRRHVNGRRPKVYSDPPKVRRARETYTRRFVCKASGQAQKDLLTQQGLFFLFTHLT